MIGAMSGSATLEVLIRLDKPTLALALCCSKLSLPDCDTNLQSLITVLGSFIFWLVLRSQLLSTVKPV